jgi:hypothetical protein
MLTSEFTRWFFRATLCEREDNAFNHREPDERDDDRLFRWFMGELRYVNPIGMARLEFGAAMECLGREVG